MATIYIIIKQVYSRFDIVLRLKMVSIYSDATTQYAEQLYLLIQFISKTTSDQQSNGLFKKKGGGMFGER